MKDGEKQALSQTLTAGAALRDVTRRSGSNMPDNFLLFLSETTPPTPPDTVLHSRTHKVVTHTQHTLCVYALLLVGITYFRQIIANLGNMSREK